MHCIKQSIRNVLPQMGLFFDWKPNFNSVMWKKGPFYENFLDMSHFPDYAQLANLPLIEELYESYQAGQLERVDSSWCRFFEGMEFPTKERVAAHPKVRIFQLIQRFRRYGHLLAQVNPIEPAPLKVPILEMENIGFKQEEWNVNFPSLGLAKEEEVPLKEIVSILKQIYCSRIGFEYMDLDRPDIEQWMQERLEPALVIDLSPEQRHFVLEKLNQAEAFETFLHTKYIGQKRFSLEGAETLIPLLAELIEEGGRLGMEEFVLGMAHRGRLNVLSNILNKSNAVLFREFEDSFPLLSFEGSGDVKYHKGFSSDVVCREGKRVHLHLCANASHLESVGPIALGLTHAKQALKGDAKRQKIGALLIHGDGALCGQGVVYELLQFVRLPGYETGGTIHLVVNNQIGFTTLPEEARSTRYCTDIAKSFGAPVFHVNAEDPESCLFVAKLAIELRLQFQCDVFIDLHCYRKYGHNEGDEPSFTQPLQYQMIRKKKTIRAIYCDFLFQQGVFDRAAVASIEQKFKETLQKEFEASKNFALAAPSQEETSGQVWKEWKQPSLSTLFDPFPSGVSLEDLKKVISKFSEIPSGFSLHPKLQKWLEERKKSLDPSENPSIDWATAECLAFGSLLLEGIPVRLSGQDSRRGSFSQRHMMWVDQENAQIYFPLAHLDPQQARFDIYNSPLSEYAAVGFEYGYTWAHRFALVLWEAQYGDFVNGAQIILDQYLAAAEQKWHRYSSLVLLLPHGYEGQGPEHSSARIERFLQLAGHCNFQVVYPTTPAQYFHILRRQALRLLKKPLVLFTPKSLLRSPLVKSCPSSFEQGSFMEVLADKKATFDATCLIFCSGKVFYDLSNQREKAERFIELVRIEQLYPLPTQALQGVIDRYPRLKEVRWVQEEPQNMGAWEFIAPYLQELLPANVSLSYVGRERSASTATGSAFTHREELQDLVERAFQL